MAPIDKEYWNQRYAQGGNSGYGSYGEQLAKKLKWLEPLEFTSVTEIGCGDFNFGKHLLKLHPATYHGYDIAPSVIEANKLIFPESHFSLMKDAIIPQSELLLCVDVLYHITDDAEYDEMLSLLDSLWMKYLVVTAYEYDSDLATHVRHRAFDVKRFGTPIVREVVEEDGQLYFYIFKR